MNNNKKSREEHNKNYIEIINLLKRLYPEYKIGFEDIEITPWGEITISIKLVGQSFK